MRSAARAFARRIGEPYPFGVHAAIAAGGHSWSPAEVFANGENGGWWERADVSSLRVARDGSGPAPAIGESVGYVADKSGNGNHWVAPSDAARPTLRQADGQHYLEFDGVYDELETPISGLTANTTIITAARHRGGDATYSIHAGSAPQFILAARQNNSSASDIGAGSPTHRFNGAAAAWNNNRGLVWNSLSDARWVVTSQNVNAATWPAFGISNDQSLAYRAALDWYGTIVVNRALTADEIANAEAYFAAKAGVTLA